MTHPRTYSHLQSTVGKKRTKAWVMGKTLAEMEAAFENDDKKRVKGVRVFLCK